MNELIVPAINFSVLVTLLGYFGWPVFRRSVADRRESIKKLADEARVAKLEAEKRYREFESRMRAFESESERHMAQARADAEALKQRIVADARKSAEWMVKDAESTATANMAEFREELRRAAVDAAVAEAERLIRGQLSKEVQNKIIRDYVEKVQ